MKILIILIIVSFSSAVFAKSPAEVISEYARVCHAKVGAQASLGLSQAYHNAEPETQEESNAKDSLDNFNAEFSAFVAFETGCNENLEDDQKFMCYSKGYAIETERIALEYSVKYALNINETPECAYLNFYL